MSAHTPAPAPRISYVHPARTGGRKLVKGESVNLTQLAAQQARKTR